MTTDATAGTTPLELEDRWRIGSALNGGYLLSVLGRALGSVAPGAPDPLAVSAHYASAGTAGPAEVRSRVLRQGRSSAVISAELAQPDQIRLAALATYGVLGAPGTPDRALPPPDDLPPPEACLAPEEASPDFTRAAPFVTSIDLRLDPAGAGWFAGRPSGRGLQQGWVRPAGGESADLPFLLLALDCLPPVTYDLGRPGWAPTVELTAHLRARPEPGWLAVRHATRHVADGLFEEDSEVWDATGRLVAQGRQLARVPRDRQGR